MGKVLYCTACTLDGFIADEANSLDWLLEVPTSGDDGSWQAFISRVGAPAMGATTCAWVVEHESLLDRPVRAQMDASGGDSWIVGGGDLVGQFDDAGLLDEIHLGMCPVTLGAGAPLLPRRITRRGCPSAPSTRTADGPGSCSTSPADDRVRRALVVLAPRA